ncbi:MAG: restriction endonuclease subunit S [Burkholderiaceae bacterium]
MSGVTMTPLRDLGEWSGGNTPSKANSAYWDNGTVPWVSPKDMKVDEIASSEDRITDQALADGRVSIVPAGSVLFVTRSGILAHTFPVAVTKLPVTINQDLKALLPKAGVSPKYVAHAVRGASQRILKVCSKHGTTVASVDTKALLDFEIAMVSLDAQHKIVAEIEKQFSRLDEAVANLQRVKANLKRYKGAVLQSVTSGQLDIEGQGSPERGEPGGWRRLTIEELASREPRSIQSGPFGSNLLHSEFQESGKLVIGIDNVQDGAYSIGASHRISESKFADLEKYRARPQDVLITVMATVGRVCVLPENIEPALITKHVYRITVDRAVALPEYVGIALRGARDVRAQLLGSIQGQTRPGLNGTLIKRIRVPIPPLAEQHRIVAEVDRRPSIVREVEAEVDANLKRAQALRQAVLSAAFRTPDRPLPLPV